MAAILSGLKNSGKMKYEAMHPTMMQTQIPMAALLITARSLIEIDSALRGGKWLPYDS